MKTIGVVMLDQRQASIADTLEHNGYIINRITDQSELEDVVEMNAIVLPVRGVNEKEQIQLNDGKVLDFRMMKKLAACGYPGLLVFAGIDNKIMQGWGLPTIFLMEREDVVKANAQLTAQGILATILNHSKRRLQDLNIDIIGYGHCGRWIVKYLDALDIPIRLIRRSIEKPVHGNEMLLADWKQETLLGDIVINTAPTMIIDQTMIGRVENNPFFIDIASKPGGIDVEACAQKGLSLYVAPPLPSMYAPVSAGEILAKEIIKEMKKLD